MMNEYSIRSEFLSIPLKMIFSSEGTADCILYVSPMTPNLTKQDLKDSLVGVVRVLRKSGKKKWVALFTLTVYYV